MKQTFKKRMAQALAVLLSVAMITCFVPQAGAQVYAESGGPVVGLTGVLGTEVNTDDAQTVYYGVNGKKPIAWRVIKYKDEGNPYIENLNNAMTLFAAGNLTSGVPFAANASNEEYATSNLKVVLDGNDKVVGMYESLFSVPERSAIESRMLGIGEYSEISPYSTGVSGTETSGYLWPLSTAEALALPSDTFRSTGDDWWLRSPGNGPSFGNAYAAIVSYDGAVIDNGDRVDDTFYVRPAFNLNLSSVLFTSAAEGGKSSGTTGADALRKISTSSTNEWKLTLHDSSRDIAQYSAASGAVLSAAEGYDSWSVSIIGKTEFAVLPVADDNEYISAILADSSGKALYYGHIANSKMVNLAYVTIPAGLSAGEYKLYIFSEQINEDKFTDYASAFSTIDLTVSAGGPTIEESFEVIFDPAGGKWKDGSTGSKTLTVESGQEVTAPEEPTKDNYDFDGWYVGDDPVALSEITSSLTVTAHWKEKESPTPETFEVIFDPAGGKWKDGSTESKTLTVESGQTVTAPEEPAKDDYDFAGWYDGDKLVDLSEITSNLTVTAHWEEKTAPTPETFEVIFDPAGGKWKDETTESKTLTFESGQTVKEPGELTMENYDFAGWYDADGNPVVLSEITSSMTVVAHWKEALISIQDAEVVLNKTTFTYNKETQKPAIETIGGMALTEGTDYTVNWLDASSKNAGKYSVTITGKGNYTGTTEAKYKIKKAENPLKIKNGSRTKDGVYQITKYVKKPKIGKNGYTLYRKNVIKFKNDIGDKKTYTRVSAVGNRNRSVKRYIVVNKKTGNVTLKKGLDYEKYDVIIKIKAKGNNNYKAGTIEVGLSLRVKK